MKKSKFTEEQIAFALRQAEAGTPVEQVCRKLSISQATFFRWKKRFGGMGTAELRRLRQLEEEDRELKPLVADLSLDEAMLQDVLSRKVRAPPGGTSRWRGCGPPTGRASRRACRGAGVPAGEPAVPEPPRPAGRPPRAPARPGRGAVPIRIPAAAHPAAARGLGGQPRADLSPLLRGGPRRSSAARRGGTPALGPLGAAGRRGGQQDLGDELRERCPSRMAAASAS